MRYEVVGFEVVEQLMQFRRIDSRLKTARPRLDLERLRCRGDRLTCAESSANHLIHSHFQALIGVLGPLLEFLEKIVVDCERRSHGSIVMPPDVDVKMRGVTGTNQGSGNSREEQVSIMVIFG